MKIEKSMRANTLSQIREAREIQEEIPKVKELSEKEWRRHRLRMVRNTLIVAIPSIVAVYYMVI